MRSGCLDCKCTSLLSVDVSTVSMLFLTVCMSALLYRFKRMHHASMQLCACLLEAASLPWARICWGAPPLQEVQVQHCRHLHLQQRLLLEQGSNGGHSPCQQTALQRSAIAQHSIELSVKADQRQTWRDSDCHCHSVHSNISKHFAQLCSDACKGSMQDASLVSMCCSVLPQYGLLPHKHQHSLMNQDY